MKRDREDIIILLLYVDYIILTGSNPKKVQNVIQELSDVLDIKDMGKLTYFLGLQITYRSNGDIFVNQSKYVKDLIHKAGIDSCKHASTPCEPHNQLTMSKGTLLSDPSLYIGIVGSLQYLIFTRRDIAFAVNSVCHFTTTIRKFILEQSKEYLDIFNEQYVILCILQK